MLFTPSIKVKIEHVSIERCADHTDTDIADPLQYLLCRAAL